MDSFNMDETRKIYVFSSDKIGKILNGEDLNDLNVTIKYPNILIAIFYN